MQGKTKSFFEDTGLILVLAALIYGGYYTYNTYFSTDVEIADKTTEIVIMENIEGPLEAISLDEDTQGSNAAITDQIFEAPLEEILEEKMKVQQFESPPILEEKTEVTQKETIKPKSLEVIEDVPEKVEVNKDSLRSFLSEVKYSIASNIVKKDTTNSTQNQELKIRITILKNGSYEQLHFVDGDKELFEMNKENILKVFPLDIAENIKESFPRYLRMSIK